MADIPINANDRRISYTAVGGETTFDTDFPIFDDADLTVQRTRAAVTTTLTLTADYAVSISATSGFATVTPTGSIIAADVWALTGNTVVERVTDLAARPNADTMSDLNTEFDRIIMMIQELVRDIASAVLGVLTLPLAIASGGTGNTTAATAFAALKQAATDAASGAIEIATDTEFIAKSAVDKALVPSNLAANPKFRAHKNGSSQGSILATETVVTFGTESYDTGGLFASNAWTPPAGFVEVYVTVRFDNTNGVTDELLTVNITLGGTAIAAFSSNRSLGTNSASVSVSGQFQVSGAQSIGVTAQKAGAGNGQIEGTAGLTYFYGRMI